MSASATRPRAEGESFMIRLGTSVYGPLSRKDIVRRFTRGEVTAIHEVSADGGRTWMSAKEVGQMLSSGDADALADGAIIGDWEAGAPSGGATPAFVTAILRRVTPAVVFGVAGGLVAATAAMPVGREGGSLRWWEDPTPAGVIVGGLLLLGIGIAERGAVAGPSKKRAGWTLAGCAVAALSGTVAAILAQGAAGWFALTNLAIMTAIATAWTERSSVGWMVFAGLAAGAPLLSGAIGGSLAILVIAVAGLAGAACAIAAQSGSWPRRTLLLTSLAGALAAAAVVAASIAAYVAGNFTDRFLVLDGVRHLFITLCAALAALVALREWDMASRPQPPTETRDDRFTTPA